MMEALVSRGKSNVVHRRMPPPPILPIAMHDVPRDAPATPLSQRHESLTAQAAIPLSAPPERIRQITIRQKILQHPSGSDRHLCLRRLQLVDVFPEAHGIAQLAGGHFTQFQM